MNRIGKRCWSFGTVVILPFSTLAQDADYLDLDNRRELFVDSYVIESLDGAELRMHAPRREGIAFAFDKPWEGRFSGAVSQALVDNPKYAIASSDSIFMSSRGGNSYDRSYMEAFIRPGDELEDWWPATIRRR